ncbi:hypothetical protein HHK36_001367 [Tetracentron sinense]|uniref:Uncharacterized protein n=1 Tax=Tetracentron sinense TaxID=13715 RepID=A0A835DRK1_TETSI|nr:hypothetical protein HHK36_001367 [Tetracentron sinense]
MFILAFIHAECTIQEPKADTANQFVRIPKARLDSLLRSEVKGLVGVLIMMVESLRERHLFRARHDADVGRELQHLVPMEVFGEEVLSAQSQHRHLLEELGQAFPDEVEAYWEIRATSAAESKQLAQAQSIFSNGDVKVKTDN